MPQACLFTIVEKPVQSKSTEENAALPVSSLSPDQPTQQDSIEQLEVTTSPVGDSIIEECEEHGLLPPSLDSEPSELLLPSLNSEPSELPSTDQL